LHLSFHHLSPPPIVTNPSLSIIINHQSSIILRNHLSPITDPSPPITDHQSLISALPPPPPPPKSNTRPECGIWSGKLIFRRSRRRGGVGSDGGGDGGADGGRLAPLLR
jgi:hypothetical protein